MFVKLCLGRNKFVVVADKEGMVSQPADRNSLNNAGSAGVGSNPTNDTNSTGGCMTIEDRIKEIEGRLTNILRVVDAEIARVENKYKKMSSGATLVKPYTQKE